MENVGQDTKQNTPAGALQGITVLDLSSVVLGPFTSQLLGDMGAEVIKVEAPEGDAVRPVGPKRSHGMSALFMGVNRNKRSIVLDLKGAGGREVFDRLLAKADVVVHSIRTEAAARLGLTHADLSKKNPRIIVCHLLGFGDDGPYAGRAAYDDNIQALTGLGMLQTFGDNREPSYVPTLIADKTVALYAANAVALALFARERTGQSNLKQQLGNGNGALASALAELEHGEEVVHDRMRRCGLHVPLQVMADEPFHDLGASHARPLPPAVRRHRCVSSFVRRRAGRRCRAGPRRTLMSVRSHAPMQRSARTAVRGGTISRILAAIRSAVMPTSW